MSGPRILIDVSISASVALNVDEVWPDGDAPDVVDAAAVAAVIARSGDVMSFLRDWLIVYADSVDVQVVAPNQHHDPTAEPLFPDAAPASTIKTTATVDWS